MYINVYILNMYIPGSSKYVKFLPFGRFFGPKGRNFTYLEDPGMSQFHILLILRWRRPLAFKFGLPSIFPTPIFSLQGVPALAPVEL